MLVRSHRKARRNCRGAALVEYALLVAGVALVTAAAVSIFGHKTNDMIAATAAVLPGAHTDDNAPIASGHMIETGLNANGQITVDATTIAANSGTTRLGNNLGVPLDALVQEP